MAGDWWQKTNHVKEKTEARALLFWRMMDICAPGPSRLQPSLGSDGFPQWMDELREEAGDAWNRKDWKRVITCCNVIYSAEAANIRNLLVLGRAHQACGELEIAGAVFKEILRQEPGHREALHELSVVTRITEPAKSFLPSTPDCERIPCPFCASTGSRRVRTSADIVECSECETIYLRTRMNMTKMEELYQKYADEGTHMALPKSREEVARSRLRRDGFLDEVLQFTGPHGKLLDIGCGWGAFLLAARERGFEPSGLELTRRAAEFAQDVLGIPVATAQYLNTCYEDASCQAVTMIHVLEHLPFPREALAKTFQILRPGGVYGGIVPNFSSFCSRELRDDWYWLDPNYHYVHYTPATLRKHLTDAGFIVERLYTATGDYQQERVRACAERCGHSFPSTLEAASFIAELEGSGWGEEVRFFARKPA